MPDFKSAIRERLEGLSLSPMRESEIVETLIEEAMRLADSMPVGAGAPEVSVR